MSVEYVNLKYRMMFPSLHYGRLTEQGKIRRILFQIMKGHHTFLLGQFTSVAIFYLILFRFLKHLTLNHTLLLINSSNKYLF